MKIPRQQIVDILRRAGLGQHAEQVTSSLPDPVELDQAARLLLRYGITRDELISRMSGSP